MNILIVDDEKFIVKGLKLSLEQNGHTVLAAYDGFEAQRMINCEKIEFVLLDLMLPGIDGVTLCKWIREKSKIPVIMLTAKDDFVDKIVGLEVGADDYVTKPFNTRELLARINAVSRRYFVPMEDKDIKEQKEPSGPSENERNYLTIKKDVRVNFETLNIRRGNTEISLTGTEAVLLKTLVDHPQKVFSREVLYNMLWNDTLVDTRAMDMHISRLREKIEVNPSKPEIIKTKWGVGYYFENRDKVFQ